MLKKINLRYALGELLIVIAGITIAFRLNNWAQDRSNQKIALRYLQNLETDIEADISAIDSNLHKLHRTMADVERFIPHLFQILPGRDTMPAALFQKIHDYTYFFPHEATYQSMLHSGDLKLISNFRLKNLIVEHYSSYAMLYKDLERHEHFTKSYSADYFMRNTEHVLLFQNRQAAILDDPFLKNLVFSSKGIFMIQLKAHEKARERCVVLKEVLSKEIENLR